MLFRTWSLYFQVEPQGDNSDKTLTLMLLICVVLLVSCEKSNRR
jgi:hypothetical protein